MSYQRLRDDDVNSGHYELEETPIRVQSSDTDNGPATTVVTQSLSASPSSEPKSTASVGSTWTIGWKTTVLCCLFYVFWSGIPKFSIGGPRLRPCASAIEGCQLIESEVCCVLYYTINTNRLY
jgi:hypothetical protein